MSASSSRFLAKDFIETQEGLCFAVVADGLEQDRVLGWLRYHKLDGRWRKLPTPAAERLIRQEYPAFHFHSPLRDAALHGIPVESVATWYRCTERASELLQTNCPVGLERAARWFLRTLVAAGVPAQTLGITGSLLIGAQGKKSDIDVVLRDREAFQRARCVTRDLLDRKPLSDEVWRESHERRGGTLPLDEYIWHESRKFNKLCIGKVKMDISLAAPGQTTEQHGTTKIRRVQVVATARDDARAFDHPAVWEIESPVATQLVSWTATYTGQALAGERLEIHGWLEESRNGRRRIVVGTSREATGEFIRVVSSTV